MKQYKYETYEQYKKIQIGRRNLKLNKNKSIDIYKNHLEYVLENFNTKNEIKSIICHGVRNENEVNCFKKIFPKAEIFGTEIGFENKGKNIWKCDFSKLPSDWEKKFDLTYSNSIDHCYDIDKTLQEWKRTTKKYMLILFHFGNPTSTDPFRIENLNDVIKLADEHALETIWNKKSLFLFKIL